MPSGHASGTAVTATTLTMSVAAVLITGARLYARLVVARNAGWDDSLIVVATVFAVATTVTMICQVNTGMGRHQSTIEPHETIANLKAFYVSIWVYNLSLTCTKLSILLQYLRIFPQKAFRISCFSLMGVVVAYGLYVLFTAVFACWPIAAFWDFSIKGKCLPRFPIWFANSGLQIVTDIAVAVLPIPVLNKLQLPKPQKRALILVFVLGSFTCILSILRLQSLYVLAHTKDVSWYNPLAAIWSTVECNTAIICSCLPPLRCMFPKMFRGSVLSSSHLTPITSDTGHGWGAGGSGKESSKPKFSVRASTVHTNASHHGKPYQKKGSHGGMEAFGRSFHGRKPNHDSDDSSSLDDIELGHSIHGKYPPNGRIHVRTNIQQEYETASVPHKKIVDPGSPSESMQDLVKSYNAV